MVSVVGWQEQCDYRINVSVYTVHCQRDLLQYCKELQYIHVEQNYVPCIRFRTGGKKKVEE